MIISNQQTSVILSTTTQGATRRKKQPENLAKLISKLIAVSLQVMTSFSNGTWTKLPISCLHCQTKSGYSKHKNAKIGKRLIILYSPKFFFFSCIKVIHCRKLENLKMVLPQWLRGKELACQCRRHGLDPWVVKIPWRRKWQHSSIFAWRSPWTDEPGVLQSMGSQKSQT